MTRPGPAAQTSTRRRALPRWAWWNPVGAEQPWTVGVEEEAMLLDPEGWTLANRIDDVLMALPAGVLQRVSAETHACDIELMSHAHATAAAAAAELSGLRRTLHGTLGRLGLRAAVSGTHPSAAWYDVEVSSSMRYRGIRASMRELARREPTFALHVHVAVPDAEAAVRVLNGLRGDIPLLLALAANSPYWQGRDSGLASARTPIFSTFPRVGIPRSFHDYGEYVAAVDVLIRAGAVVDPSFLWWDVRLQPRLGTVEVRVMDAQTCTIETAALAALVQALVRLHAERGRRSESATPEALAENRFLAARDGMAAQFVDCARGGRRAATDRLAEVLCDCHPIGRELRSSPELDALTGLTAEPAHARQRSIASRHGLVGLTAALGAQFAPAPHGLVAA